MRILDRQKISYQVLQYECSEFIDGMHSAELTGAPVEQSFKTLVAKGKSGQYYVFVLPIAKEVDLKKAARTVGEKSVEMIHVKRYHRGDRLCKGRLQPHRHEETVSDGGGAVCRTVRQDLRQRRKDRNDAGAGAGRSAESEPGRIRRFCI